MLRFSGAGVSDVGLVREHNEDSGFVGPYVALVADGVGGAAAGEIASASAAYVVSATALARFGQEPEAMVLEEGARTGMATTLSVLVCDGRRVLLGHLGDSRAYLLRDGTLHQVSRDHTYVQALVDEGRLERDEVPFHPWRNVVLRCLEGRPSAEPVDADLVDVDVWPGDRMLLCSDGLTDLVAEERIAAVLRLEEPLAAASVLTQSALAAGGRDNVTCVVLDVVDGPLVVGDGDLLGAVRDITNIVDPGAVRLA
jgi:PPM family protein phosphatase